jgi:hypothetical protein
MLVFGVNDGKKTGRVFDSAVSVVGERQKNCGAQSRKPVKKENAF